MHRPENLRQAIEVDNLTRFLAAVICGKAAMIWRMPILRCDDEIEMRLQPIYDRHDLTSFVDRERTAVNKVILNIRQNERIQLSCKVCASATGRQAIFQSQVTIITFLKPSRSHPRID